MATKKSAAERLQGRFEHVQLKAITREARVRSHRNEQAFADLCESVKKNGILQPILLCERAQDLILIAGEGRLLASEACGLQTIPAYIVPGVDNDTILDYELEENLCREDLDPIDEGRALIHYRKARTGATLDDMSKRLGKSPRYITQRMALGGNLRPEFQELVTAGTLSIAKALMLAALPEGDQGKFSHTAPKLDKWERERRLERLEEDRAAAFRNRLERDLHRTAQAPWRKLKKPLVLDGRELRGCDGCPDRTDTEGYLFPVDKKADARCLNGGCWGEHLSALKQALLAPYVKRGDRILTEAEQKKVIRSYYGARPSNDALVEVTRRELNSWGAFNEKKYDKHCAACNKRAYYADDDADICTICTDPACYNKLAGNGAAAGKSKPGKSKPGKSDAGRMGNEDLVRVGAPFAVAAWALAKARTHKGAIKKDAGELAVVLTVLNDVFGGTQEEHAAGNWILQQCHCINDLGDNLHLLHHNELRKVTAKNLHDAVLALAWYQRLGRTFGRPENLLLEVGRRDVLPVARKLFAPSNEYFVKALRKVGMQRLGRHFGLAGMNGRARDIADTLIEAEIGPGFKLPAVLEKCFLVGDLKAPGLPDYKPVAASRAAVKKVIRKAKKRKAKKTG